MEALFAEEEAAMSLVLQEEAKRRFWCALLLEMRRGLAEKLRCEAWGDDVNGA